MSLDEYSYSLVTTVSYANTLFLTVRSQRPMAKVGFRPLKLNVMIETILQNTRYKHSISDWPVVVLSYINCIVDMFR